MCGKNNMETYITKCKIDSQQEFCGMAQETQTRALYQPRGVGWGRTWEGGSKGKGYIYIYLWLIHVEVRQKTTKFCKAIIFQ